MQNSIKKKLDSGYDHTQIFDDLHTAENAIRSKNDTNFLNSRIICPNWLKGYSLLQIIEGQYILNQIYQTYQKYKNTKSKKKSLNEVVKKRMNMNLHKEKIYKDLDDVKNYLLSINENIYKPSISCKILWLNAYSLEEIKETLENFYNL